jgi:putative hemolysin
MDADCILPDGSRCGAWDLLSGRCGKEFTYCEMNGGTIEESANIATCRFKDGSTCDEYQYFLGQCRPEDHPEEAPEDTIPAKEEMIEIRDFSEARDHLADYFLQQYGIEITQPWMEQNITPEDAGPSSTFRYVSGPITIVISAEASAPYPPIYTIREASNIVNGFYWEGTLSFDGNITESVVNFPGTILNEGLARDAVVDYLVEYYGLTGFGEWTEEGSFTPTDNIAMIRVYSSGDWIATVEFEPSAPLVAKYHLIIENLAESIRWEGEINIQGEILEIGKSQI